MSTDQDIDWARYNVLIGMIESSTRKLRSDFLRKDLSQFGPLADNFIFWAKRVENTDYDSSKSESDSSDSDTEPEK